MSGHRKWAEIRQSGGPESEAHVTRYTQELREALSLAEVRRARQLTQVQLAAALEMQQSAISRLEHQTDLYVSTLRSYVEAMGGSLHIEAVFPDARVPITTFSALAGPSAVDSEHEDRLAEPMADDGRVLGDTAFSKLPVVGDRPAVAPSTPAA